jgi:hypothetical protein
MPEMPQQTKQLFFQFQIGKTKPGYLNLNIIELYFIFRKISSFNTKIDMSTQAHPPDDEQNPLIISSQAPIRR